MKNFKEILKLVASEPYSGIDNDFTSLNEVSKSTITALNRANQHIWNLHSFPFKQRILSFDTERGIKNYPIPYGSIYNVKLDGRKLRHIENFVLNEERLDKPEKFYIRSTGLSREIILVDTPDDIYDVYFEYECLNPVLGKNGITKSFFEDEDDTLNIPKELEALYLSALSAKTVCFLIADIRDEAFEPYERAFHDAYLNLINANRFKIDTKIMI